jgi:hypothetical protein
LLVSVAQGFEGIRSRRICWCQEPEDLLAVGTQGFAGISSSRIFGYQEPEDLLV